MSYLVGAYAFALVVLGGYLVSLVRRRRRVEAELGAALGERLPEARE